MPAQRADPVIQIIDGDEQHVRLGLGLGEAKQYNGENDNDTFHDSTVTRAGN